MFDHRTRRRIFGVAIAVGAVGSIALAYRMWRVADLAKIEPERVIAEGEAFGRGKTDIACVDNALDRADQCWLWDVRCETEAGVFASACLLHARKTPQVCGKFKSSGNIGIDLFFGGGRRPEACGEHGREGDSACIAVMTRVAQTCSAGAAFENVSDL